MKKPKSQDGRLRSAAIVKLKYLMLAGRIDDGFRTIFDGVLRDLAIDEAAVDQYIEAHRPELIQICQNADH
jgi:hypothetical protein